eukprot:3756707-Amphidinium_carterae.1
MVPMVMHGNFNHQSGRRLPLKSCALNKGVGAVVPHEISELWLAGSVVCRPRPVQEVATKRADCEGLETGLATGAFPHLKLDKPKGEC